MSILFADMFPDGASGQKIMPKVDTPKYIVRVLESEYGSDSWHYFANASELNEFLGEVCLPSDMTIVIYAMSEIYAYEGTVLRAELT